MIRVAFSWASLLLMLNTIFRIQRGEHRTVLRWGYGHYISSAFELDLASRKFWGNHVVSI